MRYYLGTDLGTTKIHTLTVDETGTARGFCESGPANHEDVGYDGIFDSMCQTPDHGMGCAASASSKPLPVRRFMNMLSIPDSFGTSTSVVTEL